MPAMITTTMMNEMNDDNRAASSKDISSMIVRDLTLAAVRPRAVHFEVIRREEHTVVGKGGGPVAEIAVEACVALFRRIPCEDRAVVLCAAARFFEAFERRRKGSGCAYVLEPARGVAGGRAVGDV